MDRKAHEHRAVRSVERFMRHVLSEELLRLGYTMGEKVPRPALMEASARLSRRLFEEYDR